MQLESIEIARTICKYYFPNINFWNCSCGKWDEVNGVFLFQGKLDGGYECLTVGKCDTTLENFINKIYYGLRAEHEEFTVVDMTTVLDIVLDYYNRLYKRDMGRAIYIMDSEGFLIQIDREPMQSVYIKLCDFKSDIEMSELDVPFTDFVEYILRFKEDRV